MNNGTYAVGFFTKVQSSPWTTTSGETRYNHSLVLANPYKDQNGLDQTEVITIDFAADDLNRINTDSAKWVDKQVIIPCRFQARDGRNGAWLSRYMPKGSEVKVLG